MPEYARALADRSMVSGDWKNQLYFGDNLEVLPRYVPEESVDLMYLDPPFNSDRNYNAIFAHRDVVDAASAQIQAFEDTWQWTNVTETQYADLISGGAPSDVSQALPHPVGRELSDGLSREHGTLWSSFTEPSGNPVHCCSTAIR